MRVSSFAALAALAAATPSAAAVRTFDFVARADFLNYTPGPGTLLTGRFSYDDSLAPTLETEEDPSTGSDYRGSVAEYTSPLIKLTISFAGRDYEGGGWAEVTDVHDGQAFVEGDGDGWDAFVIGAYGNPDWYATLGFSWSGAAGITGTRLPTAFPGNLWTGPIIDPAGAAGRPFGEFGLGDLANGWRVSGFLVSITPVAEAVPEPESWALLIGGFGAIGARARLARRGRTPALA